MEEWLGGRYEGRYKRSNETWLVYDWIKWKEKMEHKKHKTI